MNCDWVKANITLYAYDELGDDARFELEQHVGRCADCAAELKAVTAFKTTMSAVPVLEPTPSLLAGARMRLQESLETAEQERGWRHWFFDPAAWLRQIKFSPALAMALLVLGFVGGSLAGFRLSNPATGPGVVRPSGGGSNVAEASVARISDISQLPGTNKVEIKYDTIVPQKVEGDLNDSRIQQLLLFAARTNNSGLRMDSVNLLTKNSDDSKVREALKAALRYDSNAGVRIKALEALGPFVKDDVSVRDVMVEALLHDNNPGVRTEALVMLNPVKADGTVRLALQHLAQNDKDPSIRQQARTALATIPDID